MYISMEKSIESFRHEKQVYIGASRALTFHHYVYRRTNMTKANFPLQGTCLYM